MSIVAISTSSFGKESTRPLEMLRSAGFEVRTNPSGRTLTSDEAKEHLQGVVGLIAGTEKLSREVLTACPQLRCISRVGVGIDGVDLGAAKELSITVVNTPEAHVDAVAELTLAGLLSTLRAIPRSDTSIRGGGFDKPMGRLLRGKSVGFIGFGRVAKSLARLLAPFDGQRWAYDVQEDGAAAASLGVRYGTLDEVLSSCDIISLHLPYAKSAHHLIGAAQLAKLKDDAMLVNTARGGLVDEAALLGFLEGHPKASAYLDCFEKEPYQGPLTRLKNVVLTAHIGSYAREARVRMEVEAVENLLANLGH
ncbi:MAG: phosphoglycerate dehydrogenase [Myxococcales bacterium]|nr:phosphoglycerate dehydrogenase [Myxococcales bacterium]HRC54363.1 phosphoglycerate dehydrogenase [Kofleriaceae bacterium]